MYGRSGAWVGNTVAGLSLGRFWLYQDFAAGSGPGLTITGNDNGTGLAFDSSNIVDSSAVATKTTGEPIFTNAAELPSQIVKVSVHTAASVTLNATPAVGQGSVRVWYLYSMSTADAPSDLLVAPVFVKEERSEFLDSRFLNADLNLSDLSSASTARTNLGLGTAAVQNVAFFLQAANNLSDLGSAATARTNLGLGSSATHPASDFEVPLTFSTGVTRTANNVTVDTTQNIATLSNLTTNGVVITSGLAGTLSVEAKASAATASTIMERDASANTLVNAIGGAAGTATNPSFWVDTGGGKAGLYFGSNGATLAYNTLDVICFVTTQVKFNVPLQLFINTNVTTPFFWALNESTTGPYRIGADNWGFTVLGSKVLDISATGLGITGAITMGTGKITGMGDPTAAQDAATKAYVDKKHKAGKVTLSSGTTTKAIVFGTARADALYTPVFNLFDSVDTNPIGIPVRYIAVSTTGFTAEWDDPLQTANYSGYWAAVEHYDP